MTCEAQLHMFYGASLMFIIYTAAIALIYHYTKDS